MTRDPPEPLARLVLRGLLVLLVPPLRLRVRLALRGLLDQPDPPGRKGRLALKGSRESRATSGRPALPGLPGPQEILARLVQRLTLLALLGRKARLDRRA